MNFRRDFFTLAVVLLLFAVVATASPFISDDVLQGHGSIGRSLLQALKSCPINFEFMNYTIITSKCKGPQYSANLCCSSLKEFACPYTEQINDLTNDCASTMFSYINLYGKYPPGLFPSECREGKQGLDCSAYLNKTVNSTSSANTIVQSLFPKIAGLVFGVTITLLVY